MIALRRFCLVCFTQCCFPIEEDLKLDTNFKDNNCLSSNDLTNQIENLTIGQKSRVLLKTGDFPVLKLVVLESQTFEIGTEFSITQFGLESNQSKDGSVIIGSDSRICHIALKESEKGVGSEHLVIKYEKTFSSCYAIKDLGCGTGTFIRIEKRLFLKNGNIISFGDSHMLINVDMGDGAKIQLKFIDGSRKDQIYFFSKNECPVNFGRMVDCSIKFDDSSLSRYHCFISFDNGWFIQDGDGNRSSTNGTWLFSEEFTEIYNGMVFKAAETLFKVHPI